MATVTDKGRIVVAGQEVKLFGIDIPIFDRTCRRTISPIRCASRSVLVLDRLVKGFVHCQVTGDIGRPVVSGRCTIAGRGILDDRLDLAAEMLRRGWAFASDDAPSIYRALERLARRRGSGMWFEGLSDFR